MCALILEQGDGHPGPGVARLKDGAAVVHRDIGCGRTYRERLLDLGIGRGGAPGQGNDDDDQQGFHGGSSHTHIWVSFCSIWSEVVMARELSS